MTLMFNNDVSDQTTIINMIDMTSFIINANFYKLSFRSKNISLLSMQNKTFLLKHPASEITIERVSASNRKFERRGIWHYERKSIIIYMLGSGKFSVCLVVTSIWRLQRLPYWKSLRPLYCVCAQWFLRSFVISLLDWRIVVSDRFHVVTSTARVIYTYGNRRVIQLELYNWEDEEDILISFSRVKINSNMFDRINPWSRKEFVQK